MDDNELQTPVQLIELILHAAEQLGWVVALPTDNINASVDGMVLGTEEYVTSIINGADEFDEFFGDDGDPLEGLDEEDIVMSNVDLSKKKLTH